MRAFVTGASGFIGIPLVRKLLDRGWKVTALYHSRSIQDWIRHENLEAKKISLLDEDALTEAFNGCDAVFHVAGMISYKKSERDKMFQVNVEGTQVVARAALQAKVPRLLHVSSIVAVGVTEDPSRPLDESSPYNAEPLRLGYFDSKWEAEQRLKKFNELDIVMVNPSTVLGSSADSGPDGNVLKSVRMLGQAPLVLPGGNAWVDVRDVVDGILLAFEKGRRGERYILSNGNFSYREVVDRIDNRLGISRTRINLSPALLRTLHRATGQEIFSRTAGHYLYFSSDKAKTSWAGPPVILGPHSWKWP